MNYLEISILILFIGFLVLFYISNQVYNKCIHDKELQEAFGPISPELAAIANSEVKEANDALLAGLDAENKALAQQAAMEARFAASKADMVKYKAALEARKAEDEQNKEIINAWDKYRNNTFKGYMDTMDGIQAKIAAMDGTLEETKALSAKYNAPYDPSVIDDGTSIPTKMHQITSSIKTITPFVDAMVDRIRREKDKFDPVTGALLPGQRLQDPGVIAQMNYVDYILGTINAQKASKIADAQSNFKGLNVQEGYRNKY